MCFDNDKDDDSVVDSVLRIIFILYVVGFIFIYNFA